MIKFLSLPILTFPKIFYSQDDQFYKSIKPGYTSYKISNISLCDQLSKIFYEISDNIEGFFIQEITKEFNTYKHRDPRQIAINYIINDGGDNVVTSIYNNDYSVLDSKKLPINQWHFFQANRLHDVQNIISKRISLTVSIKKLPDVKTLDWLTSRIDVRII
jgi:hypothetical protein